MPAAPAHVFLSYRHGPLTPTVTRFHNKLRVYAKAFGLAGNFMDAKSIVGGDVWRDEVQQALASTTHFVAFLEDDYWLSDECQKELMRAVERFSARDGLRLLFIRAGAIEPSLLEFDDVPETSDAPPDQTRRALRRVGDLHFLGPFDPKVNRLVSLLPVDDPGLDAQLNQLAMALKATL